MMKAILEQIHNRLNIIQENAKCPEQVSFQVGWLKGYLSAKKER